jgi:hypothetical protein
MTQMGTIAGLPDEDEYVHSSLESIPASAPECKLTDEQQAAFNCVAQNVLTSEICDEEQKVFQFPLWSSWRRQKHDYPGLVASLQGLGERGPSHIAAPTALAASVIGGNTIHSSFGIKPVSMELRTGDSNLNQRLRRCVTLLNWSSSVSQMSLRVSQNSVRPSFRSGSQILSPLLLSLLCIVLHMVYPPYIIIYSMVLNTTSTFPQPSILLQKYEGAFEQ